MERFAYFGTPYVARDTLAALVEAGYRPAVVITAPDAPKGRGLTLTPCETKVWALEREIPALSPAKLDAAFVAELSSYSLSYALVVAYGKIIPDELMNSFPKGMLNVHYSVLPRYRGASPVERALWNDDTVTGVTIQHLVRELDAGDSIAQMEVDIHPNDTTATLRPRLITAGSELLVHILPAFLAGAAERTPQDPELVTLAPKIQKEEGKLSLKSDPYKNWLTYRALRESPGTYFFVEKEDVSMRVKIIDAHYIDNVFTIDRIIPEGKKEQPFSYLALNGWIPV